MKWNLLRDKPLICWDEIAPETKKGDPYTEDRRSYKSLMLLGLWCPGTELNCRHADFQAAALPTELPGRAIGGRRFLGEAGRPVQHPRPTPHRGLFPKALKGLPSPTGPQEWHSRP